MGTREVGGARRDRTVDLLHAMQALSQLSYGPVRGGEFSGTRLGVSIGPCNSGAEGEPHPGAGQSSRSANSVRETSAASSS